MAQDEAGQTGGGSCGCGGHGGCGGGNAAAATAAPVLTIDPRLDVRTIPHEYRHATVLAAVAAVPAGEALVLIAPHAPRPILSQVEAGHPGEFSTEWLQQGPEVWQVRLHRTAAVG